MPVHINEVDVVPERQPRAEAVPAATASPAGAGDPHAEQMAYEVARTTALMHARDLRLRAD